MVVLWTLVAFIILVVLLFSRGRCFEGSVVPWILVTILLITGYSCAHEAHPHRQGGNHSREAPAQWSPPTARMTAEKAIHACSALVFELRQSNDLRYLDSFTKNVPDLDSLVGGNEN